MHLFGIFSFILETHNFFEYFIEIIKLFFFSFHISNPEITEAFNRSYNYKIPDHFNLFEKSLQKQIINYFIEGKNLSEIEFFLIRKFQNFEDYLPRILEFEPEHELQSEHFIKVLELIIKKKWNDPILKRQLINCLSKQKCCHKKAEVYSFLGELRFSKDVLDLFLSHESLKETLEENEKVMEKLSEDITEILKSEVSIKAYDIEER